MHIEECVECKHPIIVSFRNIPLRWVRVQYPDGDFGFYHIDCFDRAEEALGEEVKYVSTH